MRTVYSILPLVLLLAGCSGQPENAQPKRNTPAPEPAKILQFYASPTEVPRGEAATLCYGVESATAVRIEPPVESLKPALSRCFQVTPAKETTYTLLAEGRDGKTVSQTCTVKVGGKAVSSQGPDLIRMFTSSASEVAAGQPATICYSVQDTTSIEVQPGIGHDTPATSHCFLVRPEKTTTYTLTATGAGSKKETAKLTIKVR